MPWPWQAAVPSIVVYMLRGIGLTLFAEARVELKLPTTTLVKP